MHSTNRSGAGLRPSTWHGMAALLLCAGALACGINTDATSLVTGDAARFGPGSARRGHCSARMRPVR